MVKLTGSYETYGSNAPEYLQNFSQLIHLLSSNSAPSKFEAIPSNTSTIDHYKMWIQSEKNDQVVISLKKLDALKELVPKDLHHDYFCCAVQHPNTNNCLLSGFQRSKLVFNKMFKTYLALYSVQTLFVLIKTLIKDPKALEFKKLIQRLVIYTARTNIMISVYVSLYSFFLCMLRRALKREILLSYGLGGLFVMPSIFIDQPKRLPELNCFLLGKIMESVFISLYKKSIFTYTRYCATNS
jgi:hypothetical protein